jgi:hypothetical protein
MGRVSGSGSLSLNNVEQFNGLAGNLLKYYAY